MKKLLVIPIMGAYYLLMAVLLPVEILIICISYVAKFLEDISNTVSTYHEDYLMEPAKIIYSYAKRIMNSDKTIQHINEVYERMKQGKPIY